MKHFPVLLAFLLGLSMAFCATPVLAQGGGDQTVVLETSKGRIDIRVFLSMVPTTAGRFLDLVDSGFYNGLTFHRVENWVIQGGDPDGNGTGVLRDDRGAPQYLPLEIHPGLNHNSPGTVAMARSQSPNSASCQFYITKSAMPQLNGKYSVFGRVISGANAVMNMRIGDRIMCATILQSEGQSSSHGEDEAVPGYRPDQPARAPSAAAPPMENAPPPKPKLPARFSLPATARPSDQGQGPLLHHTLGPGSNASDSPPPEQQAQQQQKPPEQPKKPEDSGF